ncbi:hypothetical protein SRO_7422 [Streptomyces rochei]|nr:hypothetical protein SRO_7422 [Streptomyces rochei]
MGKTGSCPSVRVSVDAGTGSWQWRPRGPRIRHHGCGGKTVVADPDPDDGTATRGVSAFVT